MSLTESIRSWSRPIYFLGRNATSFTGVVLTTSTALTMIAFWFYDVFLPGPPHPYVGILIFLILPGVFIFGLLLIPLGIWLRRRGLRRRGQLPEIYPAVDLRVAGVRQVFGYLALATVINLLIIGTART